MDRGTWGATVHGVTRVGQDLATEQQQWVPSWALSLPRHRVRVQRNEMRVDLTSSRKQSLCLACVCVCVCGVFFPLTLAAESHLQILAKCKLFSVLFSS